MLQNLVMQYQGVKQTWQGHATLVWVTVTYQGIVTAQTRLLSAGRWTKADVSLRCPCDVALTHSHSTPLVHKSVLDVLGPPLR